MTIDCRLVWVVELEADSYIEGDDPSDLPVPVCGFASKPAALEYVTQLNDARPTHLPNPNEPAAAQGFKALRRLHPTRYVRRADLHVDVTRKYRVAPLPLMLASTAAAAPGELNTAVQVLRDSAYEQNDSELLAALPQLSLDLKGWTPTTGGRWGTFVVEHYFEPDAITTLCGQYWQSELKQKHERLERRHCQLCTRRLEKKMLSLPHRLRPTDR